MTPLQTSYMADGAGPPVKLSAGVQGSGAQLWRRAGLRSMHGKHGAKTTGSYEGSTDSSKIYRHEDHR